MNTQCCSKCKEPKDYLKVGTIDCVFCSCHKQKPINNCDGCQRGLPLVNGHHNNGKGEYCWDSCTQDRYTPSEAVEKEYDQTKRNCQECGLNGAYCFCKKFSPIQESASEPWQKTFLDAGTKNGCGDLSIMISVVSNIESSAIARTKREMNEKALDYGNQQYGQGQDEGINWSDERWSKKIMEIVETSEQDEAIGHLQDLLSSYLKEKK